MSTLTPMLLSAAARLSIVSRMGECLVRAEQVGHAYRDGSITAREFAWSYCREVKWYALWKMQL